MTTNITLDMLLANYDKRGVKYRFYKTKEDALSHNRNKAGANASVTPGGFGPLYGLVIHNFASDISDVSSRDYLYDGDGSNSAKPGPLSQFALDDEGTVWIMGWGTATHTGPGCIATLRAVINNLMPKDRDLKADGSKTAINPFMLGIEMLYGKAPTAAQRKNLIPWAAATLEVLGANYTGGSVAMHREFSTSRVDPVGFNGYEIRRQIDAQLNAWKTTTVGEIDMATADELLAQGAQILQEVRGLRSEERGRYSYYAGKFNTTEAIVKNLAIELKALEGAVNADADIEAYTAAAREAFETALKSSLEVSVTPTPAEPTNG